jgi:SAM-dependent methyltransferase/glycosyltransferase involved in cell wall biosynthesis
MKVAAYSIALNEEKHAARWAETTKGADIRVVCDTGSTDRTVEILREHGVIVYEISVKPWRFDTARNAALALIPSDIDVCLSLDLDETLDEDFFDKVKKHWVPGATRGWCDFDTGHVWSMCRLHSRDGMYWKWPIHEVFVPSLDTKLVNCTIPTKMYHKPDSSKPRSQYLPMLVAACAEEGNAKDHRLVTYLCREYTYYREWELVISTAKRLLAFSDDWIVERAAVCRWAAEACRNLNRLEEAMSWADRAIELDPCGENYYEKVNCYYAMRDWGGMWETSKLVATCAPTNHYLSSGSLWTWQLNDMRALSAHNLGDKKKAVLYGQMALDANPTDQRLVNNIKFYEQGIENIEEISAASGPATSIFESIYKNSHWGNGSGPGSTEEATLEYRKVVQEWVDKEEIKTVLDLGCGDWQFSKLLNFSSVHYTGVDVVPDVIAQNDMAYGSDNIKFVLSDALNFDFPEVDLILCKDVLQHLANSDVDVIVKRIQKAAKYALICNTTYTHDSVNYNISPGGYRGLDLKLPPFSMEVETVLQWETAGAPKRIDLITRKD